MEMGIQVLSPPVEYGKEADRSSQMLRIGSDGGQGLVCGSKQNAVNEIFILLSDGSDLFRDREDDMKIVRLENFGGSFFNSCGTRERLALWTVALTATVVAGPLVLTAVAPFEMISCRVIGGPHDPTSQNDAGRTPAPQLRRDYHTSLVGGSRSSWSRFLPCSCLFGKGTCFADI